MKKIVLLFIALATLISLKAQFYYVETRSNTGNNRSSSDSTFSIPFGSTPSLRGGKARPGALFYNTTDSSTYEWTGYQFKKISSSSGGGSGGGIGAVYNGYGLIKVNDSTLKADSSTLASTFMRRKDSLTSTNPFGFVTRKILADTAAAIRGAIPIITGTVNYLAGNGNYLDSINPTTKIIRQAFKLPNGVLLIPGDTIVFIGDSYMAGSGASSHAASMTSLLAGYASCFEENHGTAGAVLEKRIPIDYQAPPNFVDLVLTLAHKTPGRKLYVIDYGLNDLGQLAPAYTPANFEADFTTGLNYMINTLGIAPEEILIMSPYWISAAGYTAYATITGNAAPTRARHLQFVQSTYNVAAKFGTMYFDIYNAQLHADTINFSGDNIHRTDPGQAIEAKLMAQALGINWRSSGGGSSPFTQSGADITANTLNSNLVLGSPGAGAVTTPANINMGSEISISASTPDKVKIKYYYDGNAANTAGVGISNLAENNHLFPGGTYNWYIGGFKHVFISPVSGAVTFGIRQPGSGDLLDMFASASGFAGMQVVGEFRFYMGATQVVTLNASGEFITGGSTDHGPFNLQNNGDFYNSGGVVFPSLGSAITDTTANKPLVSDGSGNVKRSTYWYGGGWSGAGAYVDTLYRTPGKDSIQFTIGGRYHAIKDSVGGGGAGGLTIGTTPITSGIDGSIMYDSAHTLSRNDAFYWDWNNKRLAIGGGFSPGYQFEMHNHGGTALGMVLLNDNIGSYAFNFGGAVATNNSAQFYFEWFGSGSTGNKVHLGFQGTPLFNMTLKANGMNGFNNHNPLYAADIVGNIGVTGGYNFSGDYGTNQQVFAGNSGSANFWKYAYSDYYTPTLTSVLNVTGTTAHTCQFLRLENVVTVSGYIEVDPTAAATLTEIGISLPVASGFSDIGACGGTAVSGEVSGLCGAIRADTSNSRAELRMVPSSASNNLYFFTFTYAISVN